MKIKKIVFLSLILLSACGNRASKVDSAFIKDLKENRLGNTGFSISLPSSYILTESLGPDFNVYYFNPVDTTAKELFIGGIYIGNYPTEFMPENDSCKVESMKGKILNNNSEWKVFNCNGEYSIQTTVDNAKSAGWDEKIHAFGYAVSEKDLDKLFYIFSTLVKK